MEAVQKLRDYTQPRKYLGESVKKVGIEMQDRAICAEFAGQLGVLRGELVRRGRDREMREVEGVERVMRGWSRGEGCGVVR